MTNTRMILRKNVWQKVKKLLMSILGTYWYGEIRDFKEMEGIIQEFIKKVENNNSMKF